MIRKPGNWNEVKEFSDRPKLPVGAYVCRVKKVVVQSTDYGDQLCILFDICEGAFKDFFQKDFEANTMEDKKWKGVLRQWLPKDDGSEKDEWTKSSFKGMITSFEKSNPGYLFDWNEASLVGKLVGILFRNEEWDYDGKTGWAVRPFRALSIDSVRSGDFTIPKDKPLKRANDYGYTSPAPAAYPESFSEFAPLPGESDDLPF